MAGQILPSAGDQAVDHDDVKAPVHQQIDHVTADEARSAGDDRAPHAQASPDAWMVRTL